MSALSVETSEVAAINGHRQCTTVHSSGGSYNFFSLFFEAFMPLAYCCPKLFLATELFLSDVLQSLVSLCWRYNANAWH